MHHRTLHPRLAAALILLATAILAADPSEPRGKLIFSDDFSDPQLKPQWQPQMKTRWVIAGGVLTGQPATPENQARRKDHNGSAPKIQLDIPLTDFVIEYDVKLGPGVTAHQLVFNDGNSTDATGHISSLQLHTRSGVCLTKKKNAQQPGDLDESLATSDWEPTTGQWCHVTQETRGDQIIVRIAGGPTLTARHPRFATPKTWLSFGAWGGGELALDNVRIWTAPPPEPTKAPASPSN